MSRSQNKNDLSAFVVVNFAPLCFVVKMKFQVSPATDCELDQTMGETLQDQKFCSGGANALDL